MEQLHKFNLKKNKTKQNWPFPYSQLLHPDLCLWIISK